MTTGDRSVGTRQSDLGLVDGPRKERKPVAMALRMPVLAPREERSDALTCGKVRGSS